MRSTLEWSRFLIGTTNDGTTMYRDCTGTWNNGDWIKGELEVGLAKRDYRFNWGTSINALIPATPENEAGLMRLAEAFQLLHDKLKAFLSPDMIERNFTQMIESMPKLLEAR